MVEISYSKASLANALTENGNNAGVNISIQKLVNSKYPIPNSGGSPLSPCLAWIQPLKKSTSGIFKIYHPHGDETNTCNTFLLQLANTINQMNTFQPLTSDHEVRNLSATTNYSLSTVSTTESLIFKKLSTIVPTKAPGPDTIPGWLLKENARSPVCKILNSSYLENRLPSACKSADVIPIPKQKAVRDINKDLRPISLIPIVSKLAEEVVVEQYIKPVILPNQYGTVPKSSTTHALISIVHNLAKAATDGDGALVRLVLLDFRKAFNLIDHHILMEKLHSLALPPSIINWVRDF